MSTFNNLLEIDKRRDESLSSLLNIYDFDIFGKIKSNNSIKIKNTSEKENYNAENTKEIFRAIFEWEGNDSNVYLTGSFCNWLQFFEMRKIEEKNVNQGNISKFFLLLYLPKGIYQYKYKINSKWKCNSNFPTCSDKDGNINNVITIPQYKIEEVTTDFTTSHMTCPKIEEQNNNYFCQKIEFDSLDEFSYKYYYNYDSLTNQNKLIKNNYFITQEKDILNENYSFKKIEPIPHEIINHFTIEKNVDKKINKKNNEEQTMKYGCTVRYYTKMTTFIYYKPKKNE